MSPRPSSSVYLDPLLAAHRNQRSTTLATTPRPTSERILRWNSRLLAPARAPLAAGHRKQHRRHRILDHHHLGTGVGIRLRRRVQLDLLPETLAPTLLPLLLLQQHLRRLPRLVYHRHRHRHRHRQRQYQSHRHLRLALAAAIGDLRFMTAIAEDYVLCVAGFISGPLTYTLLLVCCTCHDICRRILCRARLAFPSIVVHCMPWPI